MEFYFKNLGIPCYIKDKMIVIELDDKTLPIILGKGLESFDNICYLKSQNDYGVKIYSLGKHNQGIERVTSNLINVQDEIKLTDFPIGIVLYKERIVGQIIKMYNGISLRGLCQLNNLSDIRNYYDYDMENIDLLFKIYMEIIDILEELYRNNIIYRDVHEGNFIINNNKTNLIDFDPEFINFSRLIWSDYSLCIRNLYNMIDKINTRFFSKKIIINNDRDGSFEIAKEKILNLRKRI